MRSLLADLADTETFFLLLYRTKIWNRMTPSILKQDPFCVWILYGTLWTIHINQQVQQEATYNWKLDSSITISAQMQTCMHAYVRAHTHAHMNAHAHSALTLSPHSLPPPSLANELKISPALTPPFLASVFNVSFEFSGICTICDVCVCLDWTVVGYESLMNVYVYLRYMCLDSMCLSDV